MEHDASIGESTLVAVPSSQELKTVMPHTAASELTQDNTTSEIRNNPGILKDHVELETKEETNMNNDHTITETDTSATLTANANYLESFKMQPAAEQQIFESCMEDAQNLEVVESLETQRTQHMANPPVLHKTSSDAASSIDASIASCDEDDRIQNDQQPKKEDSYEITAPSEVEDRSSMHRIGNSPFPALNATDHLCTGIGKCVHVFG